MTRRSSGRQRKRVGDQGERTVLLLLEKAGWIAMNGSSTLPGVDVIAYWQYPKREKGEEQRPRAFGILHAEAKNEPWAHRGRRYLGPISARWEAQGVLYRVFTHERDGWWVRQIEYRDEQARTVYKAPATIESCSLGGLLTGMQKAPVNPKPAIEEE